MTTKLSTENLRQAVNICNRFIALRPTLPVLANIKLESQKTKLKLWATNLENSIVMETPCSGEAWESTVPAKLLVEFLNQVKGNETKLELDKENITLDCGEAKGSFNTIAVSEFPTISFEKGSSLTIDQKDLQQAVKNVVFAASADPGKPVLNGILLRSKEKKLLLVATDSYRLAQGELKEQPNLEDTIVPARSFSEAIKIAGELGEEVVNLETSAANNQLLVSGKSFQIATRLIDGVYPAYEQIIPNQFIAETILPKEEMISAVKQTAVFARDTGNVVKLFVKSDAGLKLWASTKQVGEGTSSVTAKSTGESLEIAFNSHFLLEGLSAVEDKEVRIRFAGELKPAIIDSAKEPGFRYIVMPVKPQN